MKHAEIENSLGCHESAITTKFYPKLLSYFDTPFSAISSVPNLLALRGSLGEATGQPACPVCSHCTSHCVASGICCTPNYSSVSHMSP